MGGTAAGTAALTTDTVFFVPTFVTRAVNIDRVGLMITSSGASGASLRFGKYSIDPATGLPLALTNDWGTVAADGATGAATVTVAATLSAGWNMLAVTSSAAAPQVRKSVSGALAPYLGQATITAAGTPICWFTWFTAAGALPSPPPAAPNVQDATQSMPLIMFRVAA